MLIRLVLSQWAVISVPAMQLSSVMELVVVTVQLGFYCKITSAQVNTISFRIQLRWNHAHTKRKSSCECFWHEIKILCSLWLRVRCTIFFLSPFFIPLAPFSDVTFVRNTNRSCVRGATLTSLFKIDIWQ